MTTDSTTSTKFTLHYKPNTDGSYNVYSGPESCKELWDYLGQIKCMTSVSNRLDKKYKLVYTWAGNSHPLLEWEIQQLADKVHELNGEHND